MTWSLYNLWIKGKTQSDDNLKNLDVVLHMCNPGAKEVDISGACLTVNLAYKGSPCPGERHSEKHKVNGS